MPPTGVQIGVTPHAIASIRLIGRPSKDEDKQKASALWR